MSNRISPVGGAPEARQIHYPYGEVRWAEGSPHADYGYTGQRYDAGSALLFLHARYYDPALGRFISADTIVPEPGDPQDFNRYAYVRNNPLRYKDPTGHAEEPGDFSINPALPPPPPWRLEVAQLVERWLGEDSIKTFLITNWFLQLGGHRDGRAEFYASHPFTRILKHHEGVNEARADYYVAGCPVIWRGSYSPGDNPLDKLRLQFGPGEGRTAWEILNHIPDSEATVMGTLGGYRIQVRREEDVAAFTVRNLTSIESGTRIYLSEDSSESISLSNFPTLSINWLSLGPGQPLIRFVTIIPSNSRSEQPLQLGGNLEQFYMWSEPVYAGCPYPY